MAPAHVTHANEKQVWQTLYGDTVRKWAYPIKYKFNDGDFVRISGARRPFQKGYEEGWTEEIFVVKHCYPRTPVVYQLKDLDGEDLKGLFYERELIKVKKPELYSIEKVLQTKGVGKRRQCLVKWKGYPDKFNQWIPESEVVAI